MLLSAYDRIDASQLESCWGLYIQAFDELRTRAVQRHLMTRDEFDSVMGDRPVTSTWWSTRPRRTGCAAWRPCPTTSRPSR